MAIGAGGHILQNGVALGLANIAKAPVNERDGGSGKGLNNSVSAVGGHERHVAVEDGRAHRIWRGRDGDPGSGCGNVAAAITGNGDCGRMKRGVRLDGRPCAWIGGPCPGSGLLRGKRGRLVGAGDALGIDGANLHPFSVGEGTNGLGFIGKGNLDLPGSCRGIAPQKHGRRNAWGEDGAVLGVVDRDRRQLPFRTYGGSGSSCVSACKRIVPKWPKPNGEKQNSRQGHGCQDDAPEASSDDAVFVEHSEPQGATVNMRSACRFLFAILQRRQFACRSC